MLYGYCTPEKLTYALMFELDFVYLMQSPDSLECCHRRIPPRLVQVSAHELFVSQLGLRGNAAGCDAMSPAAKIGLALRTLPPAAICDW